MKRFLIILLAAAMLLSSGCAITAAPEPPEPSPTPKPEPRLEITELMTKNKASLRDGFGDFSPWCEIENVSGDTLSLAGYSLGRDGAEQWSLPERELAPGERLLVFFSGRDINEGELHASFTLRGAESLLIIDPEQNEYSLPFGHIPGDFSLQLKEGGFIQSSYISPGYENTSEGYELFQQSLLPASGLMINEVMTSNRWDRFFGTVGNYDWVELKNFSDEYITLSDYYISDDMTEPELYRLPEKILGPWDEYVLRLGSDSGRGCDAFELDSEKDRLYLSDSRGIQDYVLLRDIPLNGSFGRMDGENGWFFFLSPSPGKLNQWGSRLISEKPVSLTRDGVYNDVESVSVELSAPGKIYYTTDGSLPDETDIPYEGAIELRETGVIRAVSSEEGRLISPPLSLSFIINENHSLPVASLVADEPRSFDKDYNHGRKNHELPGSFSLYEPEGSFNIGCGIELVGQNSLTLPKKSLKLSFRGAYGGERLDYDLFDEGLSGYSSIVLRAGQDNHRLIFRQEIWQQLGYELNPDMANQHSKFCILYINGEYYGIFCIKEDISRRYYADLRQVSKDSVRSAKFPELNDMSFRSEIYDFISSNDMSLPENYAVVQQNLDVEKFIDWILIEGVSANIDLFRNTRFFRSTEEGGRWEPVLFDLDHTIINDFAGDYSLERNMPPRSFPFNGIMGRSYYSAKRMNTIIKHLLTNESFRTQLISRYAEVWDSVLSNQRILELMDEYQALLAPEVERDWNRWGYDQERWYGYIEHVRRVITEMNWQELCRENFCRDLDMSEEEIQQYFG